MLKEIFNQKVNEIKQDPLVQAILLVGSNQNINNVKRDIDLIVFTNNDEFMREVITINAIEFDLSYIPISSFQLSPNQYLFLIPSLKNYQIIYQKEAFNIDRILEVFFHLEVEKLTTYDIDYLRFKITEDYKAIKSRLNSRDHAIFLMNCLFKEVLIVYYKLHRIILPKTKKLLEELKHYDESVFILGMEFLSVYEVDQKFTVLEKLIHQILVPYGGMLDRWEKGKFPLK